MGTIVAGLASTHALTFMAPSEWDEFRERIAKAYERRYGEPPVPLPEVSSAVEAETLSANEERYQHILDGISDLKARLARLRPDVIIIVGDDQNENFPEGSVLPQIAIFTGADYTLGGRPENGLRRVSSHPRLAQAMVKQAVEDGFDVAFVPGFADGKLTSHAHYQIIQHVIGETEAAIVPVFVNALHQPAPSPARCLALGESLAEAVRQWPEATRVVLVASGGLSHFTSGYPWKDYDGPFRFGSISSDFDRRVVAQLKVGDVAALKALTSQDLLDHGNIELRSWLTLLGAIGPVPATRVVYEPFHRGIMGMAVGAWEREDVAA
jgi:hypothetical protein